MKKLFISTLFLIFLSAHAQTNSVAILDAFTETTPLPTGFEESDDAAIWVNSTDDSQSLILGVNKAKKKHGGNAGLGVYNLQGQEIQYLSHDRLNNIDLRYNVFGKDIATASNRDKKAISVFSINSSGAQLIADLPTGISEEPYGLCMQQDPKSKKTFVWMPMKSGMLYQFELQEINGSLEVKLIQSINTAKFLTKEEDQYLIDLIVEDVFLDPEVTAKDLKDEIKEELSERHQLEGCVADDENHALYVGMENLGVWKLSLDPKNSKQIPANLIFKVEKSKFTPDSKQGPWKFARATNDIEGISLYKTTASTKGALIISVQGLSEFAVLDRITHNYLGSFAVNYGSDPITETDGFTISSQPMGGHLYGLMVMHDHHNTDENGNLLKANYKFMDMNQFLTNWPEFTP